MEIEKTIISGEVTESEIKNYMKYAGEVDSGMFYTHPNTRIFHLTHTDGDAVGCALVIEYLYKVLYNENIKVLNTYYVGNGLIDKKINEIINNEEEYWDDEDKYFNTLIISDNSCSLEMWEKLGECKYFDQIFMFDHHKTNPVGQGIYKNNMVCIMSQHEYVSAAELMFDWFLYSYAHELKGCDTPSFNTLKKLENAIKDISRYDTWAWKKDPRDPVSPPLSYFSALSEDEDPKYQENVIASSCSELGLEKTTQIIWEWISSEYYPLHLTDEEFKDSKFYYPPALYTIFDTVNNRMKRANSNIDKFVVLWSQTFNNISKPYHVACFIGNNDRRQVADLLLTKFNAEIDLVIMLFVETRTLSFRTNKPNIDVSRIAMSYGGGGHREAAGAKVNSAIFLDYLAVYYLQLETCQELELFLPHRKPERDTIFNTCEFEKLTPNII